MKPALRAHLLGLACALLAGPATLGAVIGLNRLGSARAPEARSREVSFQVEPPPPRTPPPRPERQKPPPPQRAPRHAPLPPLPSLAADLSGVDVDLPAFQPEALRAVEETVLGDLEDVVHTEATVDRRPTPRLQTPIEVPAAARARNLAGRLVLSVLIGDDGQVRRVKVLEADPPGVFEEATVRAVSGWVFEPATYKDRPVEVWATLPIEFKP